MFKHIFFTAFCMLVGTLLPGCGKLAPEVKVTTKSEVKADVSGTVKTESTFTFKIDVSGCDKLEGANQANCITEAVKALGDLVAMVKQATCKDDACRGLK